MKNTFPAPLIILPATNLVPKKIAKRKTVECESLCVITLELVKTLGEPLANTSIAFPET